MGLYFTFPITILIEVVFPFAFAFWVTRRFHTSWRLVGVGGLIFLISQIVQIPILDGINSLSTNKILIIPTGWQLILFNAVIGGLVAGLCEESIRLAGFKILKKPAQNNGGALTLGTGQAGVESILGAGLPMLGTFVSMVAFKTVSPQDTASLDQATLAQLASLWQMPWLTPLASALGRLVGMMTQITLTFLILQVFVRKSYWYFGAAIVWHAFVIGLISGLASTNLSGDAILGVEVLLGLFSAGILWFLLARGKREKTEVTVGQAPA